jgi:hypothetical protein
MDEELKEEIKYRLRSPFYSSLLVGFVIWNWKAILVMIYPMDDMELSDRFDWVSRIYEGDGEPFIHAFALPVLTAVIAIGGVPWFVNLVDRIGYKAIVERRNLRMESDGKLRPTQKVMQALKDENHALQGTVNRQEAELTAAQLKVKEQEAAIETLRLGYIVGATGTLAHDKAALEILRKSSGPKLTLSHNSQHTHTLLALRAIEQVNGAHEFELTGIGKALRDYIIEHMSN